MPLKYTEIVPRTLPIKFQKSTLISLNRYMFSIDQGLLGGKLERKVQIANIPI